MSSRPAFSTLFVSFHGGDHGKGREGGAHQQVASTEVPERNGSPSGARQSMVITLDTDPWSHIAERASSLHASREL